MTKREMFDYIAKNLNEDEVVAFCENEIALIDRKNAKAKERAAKKAASDELYMAVQEALTNELEPRDVITSRISWLKPALPSRRTSRSPARTARPRPARVTSWLSFPKPKREKSVSSSFFLMETGKI